MSQPTPVQIFSFGNTPEMQDLLVDLVIQGKKTATSSAVSDTVEPAIIGTQSIVTDSQGRHRLIIETTECIKRRFNGVDASFAYDEGEGDRTLEYWRKEHKDFFMKEGTYSDNMELWCERFKLVKILPMLTDLPPSF